MNSVQLQAVAAKLDSIIIDPKAHSSINYARARSAIEDTFKCRAEKRLAKMAVIQHLHGEVIHPIPHNNHVRLPNYVQFADNTKARF